MANNYESGATHVPADCFAPGGAEAAVRIYSDLQDILAQDDRPTEFDDFYADCLDIEMGGDGALYIASGDEYFCPLSFEYLIEKLAEHRLLIKSFGLSVAYYCSKLRPDEHGGVYYRAFPNGDVLALSTQLDCLTDEQFRHLVDVREHPSAYTPMWQPIDTSDA
jgi:hypothetical protein